MGTLTNSGTLQPARRNELLESLWRAPHRVVRRVGGVADIPDGFAEHARKVANRIPELIRYIDQLATKNVIFQQRTRGVGVVTRDNAISWGWTGPCGRASGLDYDIRRDHPYGGYDALEFDVPVRNDGDTFSRYMVRMEEMRQSLRIIHRCRPRRARGAAHHGDHRVALPTRTGYGNIEADEPLCRSCGFAPPVGEVYSYTESPTGELGFWLVSDGRASRTGCWCAASFYTFAATDGLRGQMVSDPVAILGAEHHRRRADRDAVRGKGDDSERTTPHPHHRRPPSPRPGTNVLGRRSWSASACPTSATSRPVGWKLPHVPRGIDGR
jgi:NADH:ubiquinone oxidoreductase subunit D